MDSSILTGLSVSAALLLLSACTKMSVEEQRIPLPSDEPIEFAVGGQATKGEAPITTLAALADQDFSASAWYSPEGRTFEGPGGTTVQYFENHRFGYIKGSGEDDSYANHGWQGVTREGDVLTADPVYYPFDGTLSYFCYAPYRDPAGSPLLPVIPGSDPESRYGGADIQLEAPVTDAGIISRLPRYLAGSPLIRVTPAASAADQVDLLVAPPMLNRSRVYPAGQSPVDFSGHRMVRVEFRFNKTGSGEEDAVRVTRISLKNIIGSKYLYFTQNACVWSDAVSPAEFGTDFPRAGYQITVGNQELLDQENVPVRNAANDNHIAVQTEKGTLFLLPQVLPADAELEVGYFLVSQQQEKSITYLLSQYSLTAWPEGRVVSYRLTLDLNTP